MPHVGAVLSVLSPKQGSGAKHSKVFVSTLLFVFICHIDWAIVRAAAARNWSDEIALRASQFRQFEAVRIRDGNLDQEFEISTNEACLIITTPARCTQRMIPLPARFSALFNASTEQEVDVAPVLYPRNARRDEANRRVLTRHILVETRPGFVDAATLSRLSASPPLRH